MSDILEPIDWITLKKRVAEMADEQRQRKMSCERTASSDDKILSQHKEYWLRLAARHEEMARVLDTLWQEHLP